MISFKDFFKRWSVGVKSYANSTSGLLLSKLFLMGNIIFGLLLAGIIRLFQGAILLGWVFVCFGLVTAIDFRLLFKTYKNLKKQEKLFGGLGNGVKKSF